MSTMIALFLVLSTLAGCASEALINVKNSIPPPDSPPAAVFRIETDCYDNTFLDGDGTELAVCSYEFPVLKTDSKDSGALAKTTAFNEPFAAWKSNGDALAEAAKTDRALWPAGEVPITFPYTDELRCTVYQTERLISVSGVYYTFTGGAHPNTVLLSWNFDLQTGEFFSPALLDEERGFHDAVVQALKEQARQRAENSGQKPADFFWEDYTDTLENWSSYAVNFDSEGMTVGFSPYELACYAAGPQIFKIPYDALTAHLSEENRALLGLG